MIVLNFGKKEKPKYGKVIALTALTVALAEAAAFIGLRIAKRIADSKIEPNHSDDDFIHANIEDCSVEFEAEETEDEATEEIPCEFDSESCEESCDVEPENELFDAE